MCSVTDGLANEAQPFLLVSKHTLDAVTVACRERLVLGLFFFIFWYATQYILGVRSSHKLPRAVYGPGESRSLPIWQ